MAVVWNWSLTCIVITTRALQNSHWFIEFDPCSGDGSLIPVCTRRGEAKSRRNAVVKLGPHAKVGGTAGHVQSERPVCRGHAPSQNNVWEEQLLGRQDAVGAQGQHTPPEGDGDGPAAEEQQPFLLAAFVVVISEFRRSRDAEEERAGGSQQTCSFPHAVVIGEHHGRVILQSHQPVVVCIVGGDVVDSVY